MMHTKDLLEIYVIDAVKSKQKKTDEEFSVHREIVHVNAQVLIYLPFVIIIIKQISHTMGMRNPYLAT